MSQSKLEQTIFLVLLGIVFAYGLQQTFDFARQAASFPRFVTITGLILVVAELIRLHFLDKTETSSSGEPILDDSNTDVHDVDAEKSFFGHLKDAMPYIVWIIGVYIATLILGFIFAVPIFMFAFLYTQAKMKPLWALLLALTTVSFIFVVGDLLTLRWPKGILGEWIKTTYGLRDMTLLRISRLIGIDISALGLTIFTALFYIPVLVQSVQGKAINIMQE